MTAIPQPGSSRTLSERILKPLRDVRLRQWKIAAARGLIQSASAALLLLLPAALLLGYFGGMPAWLRLAIAAVTWATVLAAAAHFLRPAFRRRSLTDAALLVERNASTLQERISSAVELANEPEPFAGSPLLLRHLNGQAEADAAAVDPRAVVPADSVRRWALTLIPLTLLWLTFSILSPRQMFAGAFRIFVPWEADLPTLLARIAVTPGDVTVPEGDALEIKTSLNAPSGPQGDATHALLLAQPLGATDPPSSRDMKRLTSREFQATLENLRQTFRYRVTTGLGESPWYTATVLPRPNVLGLDLRYDYPAYTGIESKTVANSDGALRALQGTDVTLTIHAADALDHLPGKSRITVTEGSRQRTVDVKALEGQPNTYEARLTLFNSGSYRVQLVNRHALSNQDDQPRPIVADLDRPPTIVITAPAAQATVRSDDDVPVVFSAGDDFGVAAVKALVQVDDGVPRETDVRLDARDDRRQFDGQYLLSLPDHLTKAGVDTARTITYWLKATDNRDPDPQTAESARHTLKIDDGQSLPYRARVEQEQARELTQAIDKAIQRLDQARGPVDSLKSIDPRRAMDPGEKARAEEQRDHLARTGKELDDAADANLGTAFGEVAAKAQAVAQGPVQGAAESVARSRLAADEAEPRKKAATEAVEQIAAARKELEGLKKGIEARAKEVQAARELEKLAERQTRLADAQEKVRQQAKADASSRDDQDREARQKLRQRQHELLDRLNRTIGQSEVLRDPKAAELAVRLRELLDRLQQVQRDQAQVREQVGRQQQVAALQEHSEQLAARQRELNDAVEQFAQGRAAELRKADARAPDREHQAGIVNRLLQDDLEQGRGMQRASADQLKQAAKQLESRGRSNDLRPDHVQQNTLTLLDQGKQWAQQAAEQAKQTGQKLKEAKAATPANLEQTAAAQKALEQAADAIRKQAESAETAVAEAARSDDATAKKAADEAQKSADAAEEAGNAARDAARQDNADQAVERLADAGKQLVVARQQAVEAVKADLLADQQAASKAAAEQARDLADRQAALADESKENAEALGKAKKDLPSAQDLASRQNQLKDQTVQAKQQADQLEQAARAARSPLAERAAAAEQLLDDAAAAEAEAAQRQQAVAQARQQSKESLKQAAEANQQAAQLRRQAAEQAEQAQTHQQHAQAATQNLDVATARGDEAWAKNSRQQADQAKQQAAAAEQRSAELRQQASAAARRASESVAKADAVEDGAVAARQQSAVKQGQAQDALARAEGALRDLDRMEPQPANAVARKEAKPSDANHQGEAQPSSDAQAKADRQDARAGQEGREAPPPLTPQEALRQAAMGAQEAAQAQQQSLNNGNDAANTLEASQQAAAALQQAAEAMAAAVRSSVDEAAESVASGRSDEAPQQGKGQSRQSGEQPGAARESHRGIGVAAGGTDERPQSVRQLGISAGDWARLGPLTQQELLNAAQQNGPPAYREMIKNYYVRIARLDREGVPQRAREQRNAQPK